MKKIFLLLAGVMIALCVTACTPKTSAADNSLEAQIQRSQDYLDYLKKRADDVEKESRDVEEKLEKIDRLQKALS